MKKFIFWFFTAIQIMFFIGIFVLKRLSNKHMTINRIILYKNRTWEAELPMDSLLSGGKVILIALAFLAIFILIVWVVKSKSFHFYGHMQLLALAVIAGGGVVFISTNSVHAMRTYYFANTFLFVITAIQIVKVSFFLKGRISCR